MNQLTEHNLCRGVELAFEMEKSAHIAGRGIAQLNYKIKNLAIPQKPDKPKQREAKSSFLDTCSFLGSLLGGLGVAIGAVYGIVGAFINYDFLFAILMFLITGALCGAIGGLIGAAAGFIISWVVSAIKEEKDKRYYEEAYKKDLEWYESAVVRDEVRVKNELVQKAFLEDQKRVLVDRNMAIRRSLNELYDTLGLDEQYRNIIAIGYMYELLSLNVSRKLEGVDGLYYLVRQELKFDVLKEMLSQILDKLDEVIGNQERLYREMKSVRQRCDDMISSTMKVSAKLDTATKNLNQIAQNTEIAAYNTEAIRQYEEFDLFIKACGGY